MSVAPTANSYLRYGVYDGNVARGAQTGMMGPQFNGYYFHIWEAGVDWILADKYPGNFGAGLWYQTGVLSGANDISEDGCGGFYLFGSQRMWSNENAAPKKENGLAKDGKQVLDFKVRGGSVPTSVDFGLLAVRLEQLGDASHEPVVRPGGDWLRVNPSPSE